MKRAVSHLPAEYQPIGLAMAEFTVDVVKFGAELVSTVSAAAEKILAMENSARVNAEANATAMYCHLQHALQEQYERMPMDDQTETDALFRQLSDVRRTVRELADAHVNARDREVARLRAAETITEAALGNDGKQRPAESAAK